MKKSGLVLLASLLTFSMISCGGEKEKDPVGQQSKIVEDISIKTTPKTDYTIGESFVIEGGIIELHYEGGETGELAFTDPSVTVTTPDMTTVGTKTVTVEYDGFVASYQITVKAQTFKVTLDLNYDGAPEATIVEVEVGGYANEPETPIRTDYKFVGWFTDKECTTPFDFSTTTIDGNITLYAKWVKSITVSFNVDGENIVKEEVEEKSTFAEYLAPSVLREGYQFLGWYNGDELFDFTTEITTSVNLVAKWKEIPEGTEAHIVTIDFNNGDKKYQYYVADGSTTFKPSDIISTEDKEFLGWFDAKTGGKEFDFTTKITDDTTIYAQYKVSHYVVNFKYVIDGEERIFKTSKVEPGEKAKTTILTPKVDNYKFNGKWYIDKECTTLYDFDQIVTSDLDLYTKSLKKNRFEAEYVNIDPNKAGVGSSDTFSGLKLIFEDNGTANASNGYWVSGLYNNGSFIDFVIYSTKEFDDGVLELSLSAEWADMYLAPETMTQDGTDYYGFEIATYKGLTDEEGNMKYDASGYGLYDETTKTTVDYSPIQLLDAISFSESAYDKRPFTSHIMTSAFKMYEGYNVIRMTVTNDQSPFDGTMNAYAPMIDCMDIYTDSTLSWTPKTDNVSDWEKINFAPNKH